MRNLTDRQREILKFIKDFRKENVYSPSIREIQKAFGFASSEGVMGHLRALKAKKKVTWVRGVARTLREL